MQTLFTIEPNLPPGFLYEPQFITPDEERGLRDFIAGMELHTFKFQGFEAKRKVASFGYDYNFENRHISAGKEIPDAFKPLITKTARRISIAPNDFNELLVTEYPPGAV